MSSRNSMSSRGRWNSRGSRNLVAVILSIVVVNAIMLAVREDGQAKVTADYQKNGVLITWTEPTQRITGEKLFSSEVAGYNIFRSLNGEEDYRKINDQLIKDTGYVDPSIEWGMCYSYALTTVDKQGLEGPRSTLIRAIPPLVPPSNVKASGQKRSVSLTWDKTNNPLIRGYNIFRSDASGQGYRKIASILDTDNATDHYYEYLDQELNVGKNYYYQVSTVDVSWQESAPSTEVAATPLVISQEELSTLERVNGFRATVDLGPSGNERSDGAGTESATVAVILQWEPVVLENLTGYNVYRRTKGQGAPAADDAGGAPAYAYQKLNKNFLSETTFRDEDVKWQKSYYYTIAAVDKDKNEARFPRELYVTVADLYINSLTDDSMGLPLKGGKTLTIIMIAAPGKKASVSLGDLVSDIPLKETDKKGVYYGQYVIPNDIDRADLSLTGTIRNELDEKAGYKSNQTITIDNLPPTGVREVSAEVAEVSVCLHWDPLEQGDDIAMIKVFRYTADDAGNCPEGKHGELISGEISPAALSFCDRSIQPSQGYTYSVAVYDKAGNEAFSGNCLSLVTPEDSTPPKIFSVKELSAPGTKRPGDVIRIQVTGEAQAKGAISIGSKIRQPLQEAGPGRYLGEYTVQAAGTLLETDQEGVSSPVTDVDMENEPVLVELVDAYGNRSTLTGDFTVTIDTRANAAKPPEIAAVEHNAFQLAGLNPLVAGDTLRISVQGEPGCTAYADLGTTVIEKQGLGNTSSSDSLTHNPYPLTPASNETSVELNWDQSGSGSVSRGLESDVASYRVYCLQNISSLITLLPGSNAPGVWPVAELPPGTTHYRIENYRGGYLSVTVRKNTGEEQVILTPKMRILLEEVRPGSYEGTYKVQPGDYIRDGRLTACLVNRQGDRGLPVAADNPVTIDTTVTIAINPDLKCLKADGKSRTNIQVEVKDAREGGVENREVALELFTTDEYTGIVGVGRLDDDKYGYFDNFYQLVTDFQGKVTVPYVSGMAAKTVIMRGRDMVTGCSGLGYITSYVEGSLVLNLVDPPGRYRGLKSQSKPSLTVWAENEWLTADGGHSSSKVHAIVLDQTGAPLQGRHVSFTVTPGDGRIEEIRSETDSSGEALARYFSGKRIGTAEITVTAAVDTDTVLSEIVRINLKSDAPSKITIDVPDGTPSTIFADGTSHLDLTIRVTDINDNPNRGTPLDVEISKESEGDGRLIMLDRDAVTDFNGGYHLTFFAGTKPGKVTIQARALSSIPTPQVLDKIRIAEKNRD